ncbi:MAG: Ppx/GppA family phosphatase [Balneolaceae bacterium]|nr:Ppx/GppA family phosphatase [Balneolaceae bacterium]
MRVAPNFAPVFPVKRIAAIDLGTNSFHAIIVEVYSDGSFRRMDKLKEMVLLGKGGGENVISNAAIKRGIKALKNIKTLCDSYDCEQILAYGTSAIRESENGGLFIQKSIDEVGVKINAISGKIEAELIGYSVQHGVNIGNDSVLMVDIGGGSVEFIIGNDEEFFHTESKKLGVSRITQMFEPDDPISSEGIDAVERHYEKELESLSEHMKQYRPRTIVGSSGTMENIALMIASKKDTAVDITLNEYEYSAEDLQEFYAWFITLDRTKRKKIEGLDDKRVDMINTGIILLKKLIDKYEIEKVRISTQALREGIIIRHLRKEMIGLSWAGKFNDPRRRSIFELLRKCQWHEEHSRHVTRMALKLFDALKEELNLSDNDRELLEYAGYLHDIGYYISHSKHHKHALYIIRNSKLKGFKEDEIEIMANVARYHRRSTPKKRHKQYWKMPRAIRTRIRKLSGILRVADGLDRSHYQNVKELQVHSNTDEVLLEITTEDEPYLEIWGAMRKSKLLKTVVGKNVRIERKNV